MWNKEQKRRSFSERAAGLLYVLLHLEQDPDQGGHADEHDGVQFFQLGHPHAYEHQHRQDQGHPVDAEGVLLRAAHKDEDGQGHRQAGAVEAGRRP